MAALTAGDTVEESTDDASGHRAALGWALAARTADCVARVEATLAEMRWVGPYNRAYLERRPTVIWFSTLLIARWLAVDVTPDRTELAWIADRGRLAARERVSVVNIVRANLVWRDSVKRVLREEATRLDTPRQIVVDALDAIDDNCDSGIVRTVGAFDAHLSFVTDELESERAALRHEALHDCLTGLPNRTLLYDRMEQAQRSAQRRHQGFAVLVIDLDRFKSVNDEFGHRTGDQVLKQVASGLSSVVRGSDTVARLGGDEFVAVLQGADLDTAMVAAGRILRGVRTEVVVAGRALEMGVSVGIALYPNDGGDVSALLDAADQAMYRGKLSGGHAVRWAGESEA